MNHEIPDLPWNKVGTDIFEIQGQKYLLLIDYYSKFVDAVNLDKNTTNNGSVLYRSRKFLKIGKQNEHPSSGNTAPSTKLYTSRENELIRYYIEIENCNNEKNQENDSVSDENSVNSNVSEEHLEDSDGSEREDSDGSEKEGSDGSEREKIESLSKESNVQSNLEQIIVVETEAGNSTACVKNKNLDNTFNQAEGNSSSRNRENGDSDSESKFVNKSKKLQKLLSTEPSKLKLDAASYHETPNLALIPKPIKANSTKSNSANPATSATTTANAIEVSISRKLQPLPEDSSAKEPTPEVDLISILKISERLELNLGIPFTIVVQPDTRYNLQYLTQCIESYDIVGFTLPMPNIHTSLTSNNSNYRPGLIPFNYIQYVEGFIGERTEICEIASYDEYDQPIGFAFRDVSRVIIPIFALSNSSSSSTQTYGLNPTPNCNHDLTSWTYTAWCKNSHPSIEKKSTYLWSSYRVVDRSTRPNYSVSFYGSLRPLYGLSVPHYRTGHPSIITPQ
ncbi:unnamed protein product [Psylliodes chrysocephalus]|uniref:Uncharacterized protein n=1 Tax=Psylliodes chrysocephalus TaxID=3402493 RepID=A0A9P0GED2_9CUCU|nr:unnamed protein product [Psylliodes chrysocephala]